MDAPPPPVPFSGRVVSSRAAAAPGELELGEGAGVIVREVVDAEWWRGTSEDGREGVFPASCVEPTRADPPLEFPTPYACASADGEWRMDLFGDAAWMDAWAALGVRRAPEAEPWFALPHDRDADLDALTDHMRMFFCDVAAAPIPPGGSWRDALVTYKDDGAPRTEPESGRQSTMVDVVVGEFGRFAQTTRERSQRRVWAAYRGGEFAGCVGLGPRPRSGWDGHWLFYFLLPRFCGGSASLAPVRAVMELMLPRVRAVRADADAANAASVSVLRRVFDQPGVPVGGELRFETAGGA